MSKWWNGIPASGTPRKHHVTSSSSPAAGLAVVEIPNNDYPWRKRDMKYTHGEVAIGVAGVCGWRKEKGQVALSAHVTAPYE